MMASRTFEVGSVVAALALFALALRWTHATKRTFMGALATTLVFTGLNMVWDQIAFNEGWWKYSFTTGAFAPIPVYLAQDLVWGGALSAVGLRVRRRFGLRGSMRLVLLFTLLGMLRDSAIAAVTGEISFAPGAVSRIADGTCWFSLIAIAQGVMWFVSGFGEADCESPTN